MPPHLHPRSRTTSSLFVTTVLASFLVVALPHVLPCPAPKSVAFADGVMEYVDENGRRRRRKQRSDSTITTAPTATRENHPLYRRYGSGVEDAKGRVVNFIMGDDEGVVGQRAMKRECPVPKPSGKLGELLGFKPKAEELQVEVKVRERRES